MASKRHRDAADRSPSSSCGDDDPPPVRLGVDSTSTLLFPDSFIDAAYMAAAETLCQALRTKGAVVLSLPPGCPPLATLTADYSAHVDYHRRRGAGTEREVTRYTGGSNGSAGTGGPRPLLSRSISDA